MADDPNQIANEEIEQLLEQAKEAGGVASPTPAPPPEPEPGATGDSPPINAGEMERLLAASAASAPPQATATAPPPRPDGVSNTADDVQVLLNHAEEALASVDDPTQTSIPEISAFELQDFSGAPATSEKATLELLRDVELDLKIELGRTYMYLEDVLKLRKGSVVALDKLAGDPVDVYANGRLIARGEILVLNENFCVRVAELISGDHA